MKNKSHAFKTYSREELVALVRDMSNALSPQIANSKHPLVIGINGDFGIGKSLFWDEMKDTILGTSAKQKRSLFATDLLTRALTKQRAYEKWQGIDTKSGLKTTFLFANPLVRGRIQQTRIEMLHHCLSKKTLDTKTIEKLANVIIMNNWRFAEESTPALGITLKPLENGMRSDWQRITTLEVGHPDLQQSEQFNAFLERYAV